VRKRKKPARPRLKNRYLRRAKISEYVFLKVLRGFASDQTAEETAAAARLSEKRVRELYGGLRARLMRAVLLHPFEFGWAGYFLFDGDAISPRGAAIFDAVSANERMRIALNRHAPRVGLTGTPSDRFSELLLEVTVRVFCSIAMRKTNETLYPQDAREAFDQLVFIARMIDEQKSNPDDPKALEAIAALFDAYMKIFPDLLAEDELRALAYGHRKHRFANQVLYDGLRRYLLKDPL
jgi:hypothetical protein